MKRATATLLSVTDAADRRVHYPGVGTLLVVWALIGSASSLRGFASAWHPFNNDAIYWIAYVACYLPWGFFSALTFRLEERFPLVQGQWLRNAVILALCSLPVGIAAAPVMRLSFAGTLRLFGHTAPLINRDWHDWLYAVLVNEFFFGLTVAAAYSIRTLFHLQQERERAMQLDLEKSLLEASLNQAQLDILRAKLNPHFLFNSLQNISVLTKQDPVTASRMLVKLGDLLRAVLRTDSQPESTLQDEISLLQHYMGLEEMRFGDLLDFEVDVDRESMHALVPSFILQPLVENAIVHGLRDLREHGVIRVRASVASGQLTVTITDNGTGLNSGHSNRMGAGLGLSSTRERLTRMYPGRHSFTVQSAAPKGTIAKIEIPFTTGNDEGIQWERADAAIDR